jgi:NADH-quinone oxidoreductase subunit C
MESPEQIRDRLVAQFPGAEVTVAANPSQSGQRSLLADAPHVREIARFLRDDESLQLDYCSNVTGVDWPEKEITDTVKVELPDPSGGPPKVVEKKIKRVREGCLEVVYHLYSTTRGHGPLILRMRTGNRADRVTLPSLTPVWRACEFQEREVFDLFGVVFEGHPDLRRILMWDGFRDHPMRKDYAEPDDYEWEPTPHDAVLAKAALHFPDAAPPAADPTPGSHGDAPQGGAKTQAP